MTSAPFATASRRRIDVVYHLVDERNWPGVQRDGLLSARRLIDACGAAACADAPWRRQRREETVLANGAVLRHQRPMPAATLARCLGDGLTPADWYELINLHVYFWLDPARMERQRRACGPVAQRALTIDAKLLLAAHADRAMVSPFNLGNAMRAAAYRTHRTLVPYARWVADGWASEQRLGAAVRLPSHRPAELLIPDAVPDIMTYVIDVRKGAPADGERAPRMPNVGCGGKRKVSRGAAP